MKRTSGFDRARKPRIVALLRVWPGWSRTGAPARYRVVLRCKSTTQASGESSRRTRFPAGPSHRCCWSAGASHGRRTSRHRLGPCTGSAGGRRNGAVRGRRGRAGGSPCGADRHRRGRGPGCAVPAVRRRPRLLYAGIADDPGSRWEEHAQTSSWSGGSRRLRLLAWQWADESKGMGRARGNLPVSCLNEGLSPASAEHVAGRTHPAGRVSAYLLELGGPRPCHLRLPLMRAA